MSILFTIALLAGANLLLNLLQSFALGLVSYYVKERLHDPINSLSERLAQLNLLADAVEEKVTRISAGVEFLRQKAAEGVINEVGGRFKKFTQAVQTAMKDEV